ncbi:MAG: YraN family protein [Azoarcus sp.]|nr:YraN family protein [Azoarcus sp.]
MVGEPRSLAQARGHRAEERAVVWLGARGLKLVARNVRCKGGEVDLVCLERDTLLFIEVRLRTNPRYGGAAESITAAKRRRVTLAARWWLAGAGSAYQGRPCRFDAILFDGDDAETAAPRWIRGAFDGG